MKIFPGVLVRSTKYLHVSGRNIPGLRLYWTALSSSSSVGNNLLFHNWGSSLAASPWGIVWGRFQTSSVSSTHKIHSLRGNTNFDELWSAKANVYPQPLKMLLFMQSLLALQGKWFQRRGLLPQFRLENSLIF